MEDLLNILLTQVDINLKGQSRVGNNVGIKYLFIKLLLIKSRKNVGISKKIDHTRSKL
jgi:hypothetical protein